ncbi:MAG: hypothetical protein ACP5HG_06740 [Anaerolineae bacterium]
MSRSDGRLAELFLLAPWLAALVGYFAPWIAREPVSAALAWNAYDLYALARLLPQIETGALTVNLQGLLMPLLGLAALLPVRLSRQRLGIRIGAATLGCVLAAMTLPPYPQILDAWRTPGWRVPFWWAIGTMAATAGAVWVAPRMGRYRHGWTVVVVVGTTLPAAITLTRLLPALSAVHAAPVRPGWGFWICMAGLIALGLIALYQALEPLREPRGRRGGEMTGEEMKSQAEMDYRADAQTMAERLDHIRKVKAKYEADLLNKANVVSVGIGYPMSEAAAAKEPGIVVSVTHKVSASELTPEDLVPRELDDVRVWVEEVDRPRAVQ